MSRVKCKNCLHRNVCSTIEYSNDAEEYVDEYGCDEFLDIGTYYKLPIIPNEQNVYFIYGTWQFNRVLDYQIEEMTLTKQDIFQAISWDWFGKFYFLTKEDAIQKAEEYKQKGIEVSNV